MKQMLRTCFMHSVCGLLRRFADSGVDSQTLHNAVLGGYALLGTAPNRHYANFGWKRVSLRSAPSEQTTPLAAVWFALMRQPSAPSIASESAAEHR
jgi:hypothetical protein